MCVFIVSSSGLCWPEDNGQPLRVMVSSFAGELGSGESETERPWLPDSYFLSPERRIGTMYIDLKEAEMPKKSPKKPDSPAQFFKDMSDEELFIAVLPTGEFEDREAHDELIRRYKNKKAALEATESLLIQKGKECENLEQELKGWKRYENHYQPF